MKTFKFNQKGFNEAKQYSAYRELKGTIIETLEKRPELFPVALGIVLVASTILIDPMASEVAYKTDVYNSGIVAFKYMNGI